MFDVMRGCSRTIVLIRLFFNICSRSRCHEIDYLNDLSECLFSNVIELMFCS
jgi:hypothetical protein